MLWLFLTVYLSAICLCCLFLCLSTISLSLSLCHLTVPVSAIYLSLSLSTISLCHHSAVFLLSLLSLHLCLSLSLSLSISAIFFCLLPSLPLFLPYLSIICVCHLFLSASAVSLLSLSSLSAICLSFCLAVISVSAISFCLSFCHLSLPSLSLCHLCLSFCSLSLLSLPFLSLYCLCQRHHNWSLEPMGQAGQRLTQRVVLKSHPLGMPTWPVPPPILTTSAPDVPTPPDAQRWAEMPPG